MSGKKRRKRGEVRTWEVSASHRGKLGREFLRQTSTESLNVTLRLELLKEFRGQGRKSLGEINHPSLSTLKIILTYTNQKDHRSQKNHSGARGFLKRAAVRAGRGDLQLGWGGSWSTMLWRK